MKILHVAAECYPAAKVGGLGDVAGALPKYQKENGDDAALIMPMTKTNFLFTHEWNVVHKGAIIVDNKHLDYTIIKEQNDTLGFQLYQLEVWNLLDRDKVYGYEDDLYRYIVFQTAVVDWLLHCSEKPDIIHCHDYHTALIPFFTTHCYPYYDLKNIPTILTIHNAQYQGVMGWNSKRLLPYFDAVHGGLIEWNKDINFLAAGVKNATKVNTVSNSYMESLRYESNGLEFLFELEKGKCVGIINGIDTELWNPKTDSFVDHKFSATNVTKGKTENKKAICEKFGLNPDKPLFTFIGRMVPEKAADLLPDAIGTNIFFHPNEANYVILGSGQKNIEEHLYAFNGYYKGQVHVDIGYNEQLSHLLYAGSDFLMMPSRLEPCGLNQLYAMRYGTIPIVHRTGGLRDTVTDIGDDGWGICFDNANVSDLVYSLDRALQLYQSKKDVLAIRKKMMKIDNSWDQTIQAYNKLYESCFA